MKKKYKIAVAYRVYPKISKEPAIFPNDKYKLVNLSVKTFKESLGSLKVKIWVLLDNCPRSYDNLFRKYFNENELKLIKLNGIGNNATFNLQLKILLQQNFSEIVYFAEDDYFYFPNQFQKMVSFLMKNSDVDFVSPYDHMDYYTRELHKNRYYIKVFGNKHWRTANSTCLSFLTTKTMLRKTKKIFNVYSKGLAGDASIWLCLTKSRVFNPFTIAKLYFHEYKSFIYLYKAWRYCWRQILFGKKRQLWVPIPTIATHLEKGLLSPTINWENIFKKYRTL